MRIAILSWESLHSIHVGGLGIVATRLAEELAKRGHEVYLFTRAAEGQAKRVEINDVIYYRCKFDPGHSIIQFFSNMSRALLKEVRAVARRSGRFDIAHGHDWHVADALFELKKDGCRTVLTYHSSEYGRRGGAIGDTPTFREIYRREQLAGRIVDRIITVSNAMRRELHRIYKIPKEKIDVIPNAISPRKYHKKVDPERIRKMYNIPPGAPTVFFMGRMEYQKGPDLLVEAIPKVLKKRSDVKFLFAGKGTMEQYPQQMVKKLGIGRAVRFLGWIPYGRYVDFLNFCDIVCIPSRNEPFGVVLLEAWATGRPVVATDVGGLSENIRNLVNGVKVHPNPDSIARGINYLLSHPRVMTRVGINGKKSVRKFNWNATVNKLLKSYRRVLEKTS